MLNAAKAEQIRKSVTRLVRTAPPEERVGRPLVVRLLDLEGDAYEMFFADQQDPTVTEGSAREFRISGVPVDRLSTEVLFRFRSLLNEARRLDRVKNLR